MIVVMQNSATDEHIQSVIERMVELGFDVHRTSGAGQMMLAGVGTPAQFDVIEFQVMGGVQEAYRFFCPPNRSKPRADSSCVVAPTSRAPRPTAFRAWALRASNSSARSAT